MNWALIGYGGMGHWHVSKLQTLEEINICGIYDIDEAKRVEAEPRMGCTPMPAWRSFWPIPRWNW